MFELIRGDTEKIKVSFVKDDETYTPPDLADGDLFTLTIRSTYKKTKLLEKRIEYPELTFEIQAEDTEHMICGEYQFDIEYRKPDDSIVKTLVVSPVKLVEDVTY